MGPVPSAMTMSAGGPSTMTPEQMAALAECAAVLIPSDPPREGHVAFWRRDAAAPPGAGESLSVVRPHGTSARRLEVAATVMPVAEALEVLTQARRMPGADPAIAFWGAATVLALQLLARGRLLPGVSPGGFDAWRIGPYDNEDMMRVRELAAAMPPEAGRCPPRARQRWSYRGPSRCCAVFWMRSPMSWHVLRRALWPRAVMPGPRPPRRRCRTSASGRPVSQRASMRGLGSPCGSNSPARATGATPGTARMTAPGRRRRCGPSSSCTTLPTPWSPTPARSGPATRRQPRFGPSDRAEALLALSRAAHAWPPLERLLKVRIPAELALSDAEVSELLGDGSAALAAAGVQVHWPKELARQLLTHAVVEPAAKTASDLPSLLSADALLSFRWQFTLGGRELDPAELERLAEAKRPLVRLRDQWVLIDPEVLARAQERKACELTPLEALGTVLAGSADIDGQRVKVTAGGWLVELKERLADPETAARRPVPQPAALDATLRDYQLRGLTWLHQMTSLGLGGCLADDMGLGKTITLIALHLHRMQDPATAGPTLVVCPTSLLGNWAREIERFAPGTPVRRYHGTRRTLTGADEGFVLTTYATMRLRAAELAEPLWGLVVADEAQHVKNPFSATAKALRTLRTRAKVALTGTRLRTTSPSSGPCSTGPHRVCWAP